MTSTLTDAETLRAAAAKLREVAKDASPGPWHVVDHNEGEDPPRPLWGVTNEAYHNPPTDEAAPWLGAEVHVGDRADADWFALMHSGLAEPLAAWLESDADDLTSDLRPLLGLRQAEQAREDVAATYRPALRLARTILTGVDPEAQSG